MNKAKLIKKGDIYFLDELKLNGYTTIGNSLVKPKGILYDLSLKNCQAIERGYDLDELVNECIKNTINQKTGGDIHKLSVGLGFKKGFQKALEILGDKKFGINEVVELCKILMSNPFEKCGKTYQELTDSYIQSLQQTEWDVTFNPDELDKDGCLILKRI